MKPIDLLLVNAPGRERIYQTLGDDLSAIEPPVWAAMIATYMRNLGFSVAILDANGLGITSVETAARIGDAGATLTAFVVYGHQPSASTQSMPGARAVHSLVQKYYPRLKTLFMGTHPSALPERTMREESCDFVCQGEGPYTLRDLIPAIKSGTKDFSKVNGLWYWNEWKPVSTPEAPLIQNLDQEIPGLAWDLLPMDRYRAHNWHCFQDINHRQPYVALYTSLGCPFKCTFCCINAPFGGAGIRYFSPDWVVNQLDLLARDYGVKNVKIEDEMFVLNPNHVIGICDKINERKLDLNIWAYARIDTVQDKFLEKLRGSGFTWLGIGIESASRYVRDGVNKSFGRKDIADIIKRIHDADINVGANYIFGLPDDNLQTMQDTLDLAMELNTAWANFYCAMAYPGSPLYQMAKEKNVQLPDDWIGYSQHSYETFPLATDFVSNSEVIRFRDAAFQTYFGSEKYQKMIADRFGQPVLQHIKKMRSHKLKRKYV